MREMKKVISTPKAPAAIGPYSQAIETEGYLFTSGQIPINPATGEVEGTTIEDRRSKLNAEFLTSPTEYGLEDLTDVHT